MPEQPRGFRFLVSLSLSLILGGPLIACLAAAWQDPSASAEGGLIGASPWADDSSPIRGPLLTTLKLVMAAELMALPLGVALAFLLTRTNLVGRRGLWAILAVMALIPSPIHASAWIGALGNQGRSQLFGLGLPPLLVGWFGAAVVHAIAALPWAVVLSGIGFMAVERELEESALLDLSFWGVLRKVTLRRSAAAIAAAALAIGTLTAGDMTITDLLNVRTYAEEAYVQFGQGQGARAAALCALPPLVVLGIAIGLAAGSWTVANRDPARGATIASFHPKIWELGRWRMWTSSMAWLMVSVMMALPLSGLIWRAGRVGGDAASGRLPTWSVSGFVGTMTRAFEELIGPLPPTALWSALGALAAVAMAWPLAWLVRGSKMWGIVAAVLLALTLAAPGPVVGMAIAIAGRWLPAPFDLIYDSPAIIIWAYVVRTWPYAFLILWPAVRSLAREPLEAAAVDGWGPWSILAKVALPQTWGAGAAAWTVAFVLALGELPASHWVEPPGLDLLAKRLWSLMHTGVESHLAGFVLACLTVFAIAAGMAVAAIRWSWRLQERVED